MGDTSRVSIIRQVLERLAQGQPSTEAKEIARDLWPLVQQTDAFYTEITTNDVYEKLGLLRVSHDGYVYGPSPRQP